MCRQASIQLSIYSEQQHKLLYVDSNTNTLTMFTPEEAGLLLGISAAPPTNKSPPPPDCDLFGSAGSLLIQAAPHLIRQKLPLTSFPGLDVSTKLHKLLTKLPSVLFIVSSLF